MQRQLIDEQIAYYRARASEYDDWSTAANHILPDAGNPIAQRKLDDGRQFRIIKIFYEPAELQNRLEMAGWIGDVRTTGAYFIYGCVQRR